MYDILNTVALRDPNNNDDDAAAHGKGKREKRHKGGREATDQRGKTWVRRFFATSHT
jgi:hypothetical protein